MTKFSRWLAAIATDARISRTAVRVAATLAADRYADHHTIATRLEIAPHAAEKAIASLLAAGHFRTRLEPAYPASSPASTTPARHLSEAARRALEALCTIGDTAHVDTWREAFHHAMPDADPAARRQSWRRARRALITAGFVEIDSDGVVTKTTVSASDLT